MLYGENSAALPKEKERIRLLDLSGNELGSLSCLQDDAFVQQQLWHVIRLDLSNNGLPEFPSAICQVTRSIQASLGHIIEEDGNYLFCFGTEFKQPDPTGPAG